MLRLGNKYPWGTSPSGKKKCWQSEPFVPFRPHLLTGCFELCTPWTALAGWLCRQRTREQLCRRSLLTTAILCLPLSSPCVFLVIVLDSNGLPPFCLLVFAHPGLCLSGCSLTFAICVVANHHCALFQVSWTRSFSWLFLGTRPPWRVPDFTSCCALHPCRTFQSPPALSFIRLFILSIISY